MARVPTRIKAGPLSKYRQLIKVLGDSPRNFAASVVDSALSLIALASVKATQPSTDTHGFRSCGFI